MSSAKFPEVGLGADLYVKAVESDLPHLLKHGGEFASKDDLLALGNAFRNSAKKLIDLKAVTMNTDRKWEVDEEAVSAIPEEDAKSFTPFYETVLQAHQPVMDMIENSGKVEYAEYFRAVHRPIDFEIEPEKSTVLTDEAKRSVIGAALTLVEAAQNDPANAAFVKGLAANDIPNLHASLAAAHYLMPEDAPANRQTPIGEQTLRGTEEQQDAIIQNASLIAANLEIADSIQQGDRPMMAAAMLKSAVATAETEEVVIDGGYDPVAPNPFNSDLMEEDGRIIFSLLEAGSALSDNAQVDPSIVENVLVSEKAILDLIKPLSEYREANIHAVLKRKDFRAPGLSSGSGKDLARVADSLVEVLNYRPEKASEIVSSDEGGMATESSFEQDGSDLDETNTSGSSSSSSSTRGAASKVDSDKSVLAQMREDEKWAEREKLSRSMAEYVDSFLPEEEKKMSIPMEVFDAVESASVNLVYKGIDQTVARIANRDINDLSSGVDRGALATVQDGGGRLRSDVILYKDDYIMTNRRYREVGKTDRVVKIEPGKGFLETVDYHSPDPKSAKKYVGEVIKKLKVTKNGEPNVQFRATLREMAIRPVVAGNEAEAIAWKEGAQNEVALDNEEKALRKEVMENKMGMSFVDFDSAQVKKYTDIVSASGSKEMGRMTIDTEGKINITHPDGPTLQGVMDKIPEGMSGASKAGRSFGGMIDHNRMRSANDSTMDGKGITMVMVGEAPKGFIAKIDESHTKERSERPIDRFPDMALS